ncbi:RNA-directed DNA polymerase, eukaryota, reverse transcriptase zinc-binding domain protein [Tanacetum coccineum]
MGSGFGQMNGKVIFQGGSLLDDPVTATNVSHVVDDTCEGSSMADDPVHVVAEDKSSEKNEKVQAGWEDPKVHAMKNSFVNVVLYEMPKAKVNFRTLVNKEHVEDSDFVLPLDIITAIQHRIEYEWKPPLCLDCHVFCHWPEQCPKSVTQPANVNMEVKEDRFKTISNRKKKGKSQVSNATRQIEDQDDLLREVEVGETRSGNDSEVDEMLITSATNSVDLKGASTPSLDDFSDWTSNARLCLSGCRIIIGWNVDVVDMMVVRGLPWILMGDFNMALNFEDSHSGSSKFNSAMFEFKDYVSNINSLGLHFTWNQKPKGGGGLLKKLDRIVGNINFVDAFLGAYALFQPYQILDHSPSVLKIPTLTSKKPKPFKFFNFSLLKVVSKMKSLKKPLRKLMHDHGNLHDLVTKLRHELDEVQKALDLDPNDQILREEEAVYVQVFNEAKLDEERFLKQKAKIEWLEVGDSNSVYFHKAVKSKNQRGRIDIILNSDIVKVLCLSVSNAFDMSYSDMVHLVLDNEIKAAMFDIGDDRAPSPDGFTYVFFKKGWDIVGKDVCNAIQDVFSNRRLLKEIKDTFIALIPKVSTPLKSMIIVLSLVAMFFISVLARSLLIVLSRVLRRLSFSEATILQGSSAIHYISNIDNFVHQIIKFQSILITSSHSLWSSQSFGHQKAINGFDMPLPVAVCSGLVNPLAPRKGKFHGGLITMSTLCT